MIRASVLERHLRHGIPNGGRFRVLARGVPQNSRLWEPSARSSDGEAIELRCALSELASVRGLCDEIRP